MSKNENERKPVQASAGHKVAVALTDKSWRCECGSVHDVGGRIAENWFARMVVTCDECNRAWVIRAGQMELG
tara:strand:- start:1288 stop:1503 length:216 start_codon:yes stop_codon:yes gene_type:complete